MLPPSPHTVARGALDRSQRAALDTEVERIGVIVDARPELTVGTVAVGPHA